MYYKISVSVGEQELGVPILSPCDVSTQQLIFQLGR
jgi:hypothetical protein